MPKAMGDQPIQGALDIGQGGFMDRQLLARGDYSPGLNVEGLNSYVHAFISPSMSDGPQYNNSGDGLDRRIMTADLTLQFVAAMPYGDMIEVGFYLKRTPDEVAEHPVLWARWMPGDGFSTRFRFPLTGFLLPAAAVATGDPPYLMQGAAGVASTWDRLVPAGWAFYAYIGYADVSGAKNFPLGTILQPSFSSIDQPSGSQVPR